MRLLVLSCRKRSAHYLKILDQQGIEYDLLCEINLITELPYAERKYSGVLIEQSTLFDARQGEESLLEMLKNILPTLNIKARPRSVQDVEKDLELTDFIAACRPFPARSIRLQDRVETNLPTLIARDASFSSTKRCTALNLSKGGCYLTDLPRLAIGTKLWLRFAGFVDTSPILCEIRWITEQQTGNDLYGAGIRFLSITETQLEKVQYLVLEGMIMTRKQPRIAVE